MFARYDDRNTSLSFTGDDAEARRLILDEEGSDLEIDEHDQDFGNKPSPLRASLTRALALLCVCSLSVGSH